MKTRNMTKLMIYSLVPTLLAACGCWDTRLPSQMAVMLPTRGQIDAKIEADPNRIVVAAADTGPQLLANTRWLVHGTGSSRIRADGVFEQKDKTEWFVGVIEFGAKGEILQFELGDVYYNGLKLSDLVGPLLVTDAGVHDAGIPGTYYVAESYGENEDHDFGLTAFGRYFVGTVSAGESSLEVSGKINEPFDRFDGVMTIRSSINPDVFGVDVPESDAYEITVYAVLEK